jgi:hypothetical protein
MARVLQGRATVSGVTAQGFRRHGSGCTGVTARASGVMGRALWGGVTGTDAVTAPGCSWAGSGNDVGGDLERRDARRGRQLGRDQEGGALLRERFGVVAGPPDLDDPGAVRVIPAILLRRPSGGGEPSLMRSSVLAKPS